jgi:hypothetical protein
VCVCVCVCVCVYFLTVCLSVCLSICLCVFLYLSVSVCVYIGSLTRSQEKEKGFKDASNHVAIIGEMVEDMEGRMRDAIYEVYFGKTREVITAVRSGDQDQKKTAQMNLMAEMAARRKT